MEGLCTELIARPLIDLLIKVVMSEARYGDGSLPIRFPTQLYTAIKPDDRGCIGRCGSDDDG